jgi:hypothetical protein
MSARLLAKLRASGVSIRSEGTRLVLEARPGIITPKLREEITRSKAAILATLAHENNAGCGWDADLEPISEVARLLATAYLRHSQTHQALGNAGDDKLACAAPESVHGGVP